MFVFAASAVVGIEHCGQLIWVANGLGLSYLLLAPRWLWMRYAAAIFCGMLAGGLVAGPESWGYCAALSACNLIEVLLAAFALRKRSAQMPNFCDQRYLLRFAVYAIGGAPVIASLVLTAGFSLWDRSVTWAQIANWITTDGLGNAITTPACVALFQNRLRLPEGRKSWPLLLVLIPITIGAFAPWKVPLVFLLYPAVALILFRFGLGWAAMSTLFITAVGSWFTIHNMGPFAMVGAALSRNPTVLLQLYLASGMFLIFAASSVVDSLRNTERRLRETASLHELVAENSRDVIIFADFEGNRSYVSAAAERLGGWSREELLGHKSLELVHPDDRGRIRSVIERLRLGGSGELAEYRIRNVKGGYLWVEGNLRSVHDPSTGVSIGILNMLRDISHRKEAERKLQDAYATLEALAATDPLTHLANRRAFDQCLANEWRRCLRERLPLSVLLIDADWFKSYNDAYGHPRGDRCLKHIADSALEAVSRSSDLVARIGGEEFGVILPNTQSEGARQVGEKIRAALRGRRVSHSANPSGCVTISLGSATMVPTMGDHASTLIQRADEALYRAKHAGRDRVCDWADTAELMLVS
ncbi:diguanylate cyclase domain-containing protein [Occallatibacter savannae]|uniref:bifunctional diguanylate cyclase/phosphodiesterase n=1 Tax=Occallatibacter savannae TaxID=1002691 RepID=UPI0013A554B7|nr:diguanylate cyclase [Occallatibacter savannae]